MAASARSLLRRLIFCDFLAGGSEWAVMTDDDDDDDDDGVGVAVGEWRWFCFESQYIW
jgi:hypothetical protein